MARFDVYPNPGAQAKTTPYLLDVQSDLLDGLDTRMVIPLRSLEHFAKVRIPSRLSPVVQINGKDCILETPKMGSVPQRILRQAVASLTKEQAEITGAVDFLFHGY